MLEYGREAIGLMRDKKRADLDTDRTLGLATLRCLEIVGEAAKPHPQVASPTTPPDSLAANYRHAQPSGPWLRPGGLRHHLEHHSRRPPAVNCRIGEDSLSRLAERSAAPRQSEILG